MLYHRSLVTVAITLALAAPCLCQNTFVATGQVSDSGLNKISGAQVYAVLLTDAPEETADIKGSTTTSSSGVYQLKELPKPQPNQSYYYVAFSRDQYLGGSSGSWIKINGGVRKQDVFVVDRAHKAIAGAMVHFNIVTDLRGKGGSVDSLPSSAVLAVMGEKPGVTDASGRWTFTQLPEGTLLQPRVKKAGYYQAGAGGQPVKVMMDIAGTLAGRVGNDKGEGISHGTLTGYTVDKGSVQLVTDDDGRFSQEVMPYNYTILLRDNPSLTIVAVNDVSIVAGKTTIVPDVVAGPGALVSGKLIDTKTEQPVEAGSIYVCPPGWPENLGINHRTDKNGHFEFRVAPGTISISAASLKTQYAPFSQTLDVKADGISDIVIRLAPVQEPEATGKVVDPDGKPVAGASVVLDGLSYKTLKTKSDGSFSSPLLPEGEIDTAGHKLGKTLVVVEEITRKIGYVGAVNRNTILNNGVVITAKPARPFTVTVEDSNGKPVNNAKVTVLTWYMGGGSPNTGGKTDQQGKLVLDNLYADGTYSFNATATGYYSDPLDIGELVEVGTDNSVDSIKLVLDVANRVQKGKVLDASGKPIAGALIQTRSGQVAKTDDAGEFTMNNLPDSDIELYCLGKMVIANKNTPYLTIHSSE